MIQVPVAQLEFMEDGTTLWVHNREGSTVLRIKADKITVKRGCGNDCTHSDITINGEIEICIPENLGLDPKRPWRCMHGRFHDMITVDNELKCVRCGRTSSQVDNLKKEWKKLCAAGSVPTAKPPGPDTQSGLESSVQSADTGS